MKKFKLTYILALFSVLFYTSCETTELEITSDPNFLSPEDANVDLFLNGVQEDFARFVQGFGDTGSELTRIDYMYGRNYADVYSPQSFNGLWTSAYQGMREDLRLMNALAAESGQTFHIAIGQIIEAYVMVTLVDFFGNVPYSESLSAANLDLESRLNPNADNGADIYAAMHTKLNEAITALGANPGAPANDFFYGGNASKWIKAANTLKMKMYITVGDYANFQSIVAGGNYISSNADDFQFQWGTNEVQPDTRHPWYASSYTSTGGGRYMSNWLMDTMLSGPGGQDPRMYYYFYRQVDVVPGFGAAANEEVLECGLQNPPTHYVAGGHVFCGLPAGYWGRDHGNDQGIPPDGFLRTLNGVYPAGGLIDGRLSGDAPGGAVNGDGQGGAGITPILLASWVDFMQAEKALFADGDATAARAHLDNGMTKSTAKVTSFSSLQPTAASIAAHKAGVLAAYDDTTASMDDKKNIVFEQFWIAMYGNGIDAYNAYRRTGFPTTLQPNLEPNPGAYIRSLYYPANYVETNNNATQKADVTQTVFWDNGSTQLR